VFVQQGSFGYILQMSTGVDTYDNHVVVVGLGYVGLTLAAHLANIGLSVHGVEIRRPVLELLAEKKAFFWEPNLNEVISRTITSGTFTFSANLPVTQVNRVFIITVGTPLDASGKANLAPIISASKQVAEVLRDGDFVILRSTVKLGTTEQIVRPILAKTEKVFDLAFCPERTLEGSALQELGSLPQIIGAGSLQARERAAKFFGHSTSSVIMVPDTKTAEMIKLVDNMQRDAHFAISNEIAEMCNYAGIRAQDVISSGKLGYPRTNLANPGPVGGPCLEKDSYILAESFSDFFGLGQVALDARKANENVVCSGSRFISKFLKASCKQERIKIAVLGLAFKGKPETDDLRGSPSIALLEILRSEFPNSEILAWDPMIHRLENEKLPFSLASDLEHAVSNANALIIMNNHPKFDGLDIHHLSLAMSENSLIYDFWDRYSNTILKNTRTRYSGWGNHGNVPFEVDF
jgi:UDP-N-acetyl-D-mannosaminuronic acid dehydrogenase